MVEQASDRCHRIGQENAVTIHFLLSENTIETRISEILDSKTKMINAIIEGKEAQGDDLLSELYKDYSKKSK